MTRVDIVAALIVFCAAFTAGNIYAQREIWQHCQAGDQVWLSGRPYMCIEVSVD